MASVMASEASHAVELPLPVTVVMPHPYSILHHSHDYILDPMKNHGTQIFDRSHELLKIRREEPLRDRIESAK